MKSEVRITKAGRLELWCDEKIESKAFDKWYTVNEREGIE